MNILKLVAKNLFRRKGRFIFTLLGITIGMASFVALLSLGGSMRGEVTRQAQAMGASFMIMPKDICVFNQISIVTGDTISESLDYEVFEKISQIDGIEVIPHLTQKAVVNEVPSVIIGILPQETYTFRSWEMQEGQYLSDDSTANQNAAIVGLKFAERRELKLNDTFRIEDEEFTVTGILKPNQSNDDSAMFMELSTLQRVFEKEGSISYMSANVDDVTKMESYEAAILKAEKNVQVSTDEQLLGSVLTILGSVNITLQLIAGVALIAAAFGIVNTMMTAVYERRREIGIMRAIGGNKSTIFKIFVLESGLYGLLGGTIGVIVGFSVSVFAGDFISQIGANEMMKGTTAEPSLDFTIVLVSIGCSLAISILSGLYPAWKAARLTPVEAISYE